MAEIPSHIASSAAQAGFQAREVAKERDANRAAESQSADKRIKALGEADGTVEADDADTAVFSDAEGAGSQGREESPSDDESLMNDSGDEGVVEERVRPTGRAGGEEPPHLDIEA